MLVRRAAIRTLWLRIGIVWLCIATLLSASDYRGRVLFNGLPVPGVTILATKDNARLTAVTDETGAYSFPDLTDGNWTVEVTITGFSSVTQNVAVAPGVPPSE